MAKQRKSLEPPKNFIAYFSLVQEIGLRLEEYGRCIGKCSTLAPAMHDLILSDLQSTQRFCERALAAVKQAQEDWSHA